MVEAKSGAPLSLLLPGLTQPSPRWDPSGLSKPVLDRGCAHRVCAPVQPHQWLTAGFALCRFSGGQEDQDSASEGTAPPAAARPRGRGHPQSHCYRHCATTAVPHAGKSSAHRHSFNLPRGNAGGDGCSQFVRLHQRVSATELQCAIS